MSKTRCIALMFYIITNNEVTLVDSKLLLHVYLLGVIPPNCIFNSKIKTKLCMLY